MKAIFKKNQVIITVLAIMIAIAGYLNIIKDSDIDAVSDNTELSKSVGEDIFALEAGEKESDFDDNSLIDEYEMLGVNDNGEIIPADSGDTSKDTVTGEAILASTVIGTDYFTSARIGREQVRAKNKELLMSVIDSTDVTDVQKQAALDSIIDMTKTAELENAAEMLLEAKGFDGVVVSIVKDSVDVIVNCETITDQDIAQIEDIIMRKVNVSADCIIISPVIAQD